MDTFKYTAVTKGGENISGIVEAFNEMDAVSRIKDNCDVVLKLHRVKTEKDSVLNLELDAHRVNMKALTVMCSQFAIILRAGVPIARTCHLIGNKTTDKKLKRMLEQVAKDVESGRTLADSFEECGSAFLPATFVETLRAGEESGNPDTAFYSLYRHFERQVEVSARVKGALIYPAFVLVIAVAVVAVLMIQVVPTFVATFADLGSELPAITVSLIVISGFFQKSWPFFLALALILFLICLLYRRTEEGRMNLAKWQLRLPVIGNIATLSAAGVFSNTMAAMLKAGLPITRAITLTSRVIDNAYISSEVGKLTDRLEEGCTLADSVRQTDCLPDILVDMIAVGEESGELAQTLDIIGRYYDTELKTAVDSATKKTEPAVLVFVAAVAGYIVLAVYIAMFSMYSIM